MLIVGRLQLQEAKTGEKQELNNNNPSIPGTKDIIVSNFTNI